MFLLSVHTYFCAAMSLPNFSGPCSQLHGHTYQVTCTVAASNLNSEGMVMDSHDLRTLVDEILSPLKHQHLNTLAAFAEKPPTSECIARHLYDHLKDHLPKTVRMHSITIQENPETSVTYQPDHT